MHRLRLVREIHTLEIEATSPASIRTALETLARRTPAADSEEESSVRDTIPDTGPGPCKAIERVPAPALARRAS